MLNKINLLGKKMTSKEMKGMKGGATIGTGKCILPGAACAGDGCTEPDPVCCYGYYCTGSNGIISNPGICVAPGTGGGDVK